LLEQFSSEFDVDLTNTYFIGDTLKDIQAARAVNATPILVKTGKGSGTITNNPELDVAIFEDLYHAAQYIITR
jgi:D-glycero-D-manno-heptose 1,7-bisphosphate phosphatase